MDCSSAMADLGKKGKATVADIGPGSNWQVGLDWACKEMEEWPTSRLFRRVLPEGELRVKPQALDGAKPKATVGQGDETQRKGADP